VLCNISQVKFGNTIAVLQCTPAGNCDAKDLPEIAVVPYLQLARKGRPKKAHCASAVNLHVLLSVRNGSGRVARSARCGTVTGVLSGVFGLLAFLLCHLGFLS